MMSSDGYVQVGDSRASASAPARLTTDPLIAMFDHVNPQIGADGSPYDYYRSVRDRALEMG